MPVRRKRIWSIFVIGVMLILCVSFYIRYFMSRPIGEGPAGPVVPREPFENQWADRPVRLVGIGDSITAGLGAKTPEHTFFNRLIQNPADEFADMEGIALSRVLPNLTYENLAISGSTSKTHLQVIEEKLEPQDEEVFGLIVMTTGGNDLIHNYGRSPAKECAMYGATEAEAAPWIESFRERLDEMLTKVESCFPGGCEIYIGNIYDPTDCVGDAPSIFLPHWPDGLAIHASYNDVIAQCAARRPNVHVVPLYETFLGHGSHCRQFWRSTYVPEDPTYWYFDNVEDPNDRGYDAIRRAFLNSILQNTFLSPN